MGKELSRQMYFPIAPIDDKKGVFDWIAQKSEEFQDVVQTDQWEIGTFTWNQALMVAVFAGGAALKCYIDRMVEKNFWCAGSNQEQIQLKEL